MVLILIERTPKSSCPASNHGGDDSQNHRSNLNLFEVVLPPLYELVKEIDQKYMNGGQLLNLLSQTTALRGSRTAKLHSEVTIDFISGLPLETSTPGELSTDAQLLRTLDPRVKVTCRIKIAHL
ncbi:hypothetical protein EJB05_12044 [Eragrostis curvula]|uniref:Uncharacterized protein n=1 Tax=Eragrostis curvula TaxID=38414 RepID=A0A5J9VUA6_9POAL|nr:hypothetical protein EJB05_12044 [Eragrostis curvula]